MKVNASYLKVVFTVVTVCLFGSVAQSQVSGSMYSGSMHTEVLDKSLLFIEKETELTEALKMMEERFNVVFLYRSDAVEDVQLTGATVLPMNLEKAMAILLEGKDLEFERLNPKTYGIYAKDKPFPGLLAGSAFQEQEISGTVTDAQTGEPLPGVNVIVMGSEEVAGSTIGTQTGADGSYSINIHESLNTLLFTYIGYRQVQVEIDELTEINVELQQDVQLLDEVVVVGYGTQERVNLTGSVDVITSEQIENRHSPTVSQLLQGTSPGINFDIGNFGFEPGASMNLNIRGMGSLSGGQPYVVIDGFPGEMDNLNPNDIESISVLKDAAASAVYGARAPYGVILITTKSGRSDQPVSITYSSSLSHKSPQRLPQQLDSYTFARAFNEMADNSGIARPYPDFRIERIIAFQNEDWDFLMPLYEGIEGVTHFEAEPRPNNRWSGNNASHANYDWFEEYFGSSLNQEHNLSVQGGSENTTFYLSGGYRDEEGVVNFGVDDFQRYNLMGKINTALTDWLNIRYEARFTNRFREHFNGKTNQNYDGVFRELVRTIPTQNKYDGWGNYAIESKIRWITDGGTTKTRTTENWQILASEIRPLQDHWIINIDVAYKSIGQSRTRNELSVIEPFLNGTLVAHGDAVPNFTDRNLFNNNYITTNAYTTFNVEFRDHNFVGLVGTQYELNEEETLFSRKTELILQDFPSLQTANGELIGGESLSHWSTMGYFSRLNYNYGEKYLLEANARYDGSSRFKEGNQWGFFPSFSIGWNIDQESFWQTMQRYVNTFKIRASWGQLGNQLVSLYQDLALIPLQTGTLNWIFDYGQTRRSGYTSTPSLVSPDLTWETATTKNLGLELSFLNNRLQAEVDIFERITEDMIGPVEPAPGVLGTSVPASNNATLQSRGWELRLRWNQVVNQDFAYRINVNLYDSKDVVTEYFNPTGLIKNWYAGKAAGEIWGFTAHDLYQTQEELDAHLDEVDLSEISTTWNTGDLKYEDITGDGKVSRGSNTLDDHGDLTIIGNSSPRYQYGFGADFDYKGFDFSMLWRGVAKRDLAMRSRGDYAFWGVEQRLFTGFSTEHVDYYRDQPGDTFSGMEEGDANINTDSYWPRAYLQTSDNRRNRQVSTRYLQDASYLRLQNLQVGYSLPRNLLERFALQRARIYLSGENLLTFTSLPRPLDPVATGGSSGVGMTYRADRIFSLGIILTL